MASKMNLISSCRYYHGEALCPYSDRSSTFFWMCERAWTRSSDDFSKEIKALKSAHFDDFASDECGGIRAPLSLLAVIYSNAMKGWNFIRLMRLYFGLDRAGSSAVIEKIPTHLVTRNGVTEEVEDDSWWQSLVSRLG